MYLALNDSANVKKSKLSPKKNIISIHKIIGKYEPSEVVSKTFNSPDASGNSIVKNHFFNLPAHKVTALVPELRFYRTEGDTVRPFYLPISAIGENAASLNKPSRLGASAIKSFSVEYQGTNPFEAPRYLKSKIQLHVDNLENIFEEPPESGYARLADLFTISIANPTTKKSQGGSSVSSGDLSRPIEVSATLGYSVLDNDIFTKQERQEILDSNISLSMNVFNHVINVKQDGSATIDIDYTARINKTLKNKMFSVISSPEDLLAQADVMQLIASDGDKAGKIDGNDKIKSNVERKRKTQLDKMRECRQIMEELQNTGKIYSRKVEKQAFISYTLLGTLPTSAEATQKASSSGTKKSTTDKKTIPFMKETKILAAPKSDFMTNSNSLNKKLKDVDFSVREIHYITFGDLLESFMKKVHQSLESTLQLIKRSNSSDGIKELEKKGLGAFLKKSKSDKRKVEKVIIDALQKMKTYKILLSDVEFKYSSGTAGAASEQIARINISDIPISLSTYQKFMYTNVMNKKRNTFVVTQFLQSCIKKGGLLDMAINQWAEAGVAPSVIKAAPEFSSVVFTGEKLRSSIAKREFLKTGDVPGGHMSSPPSKANDDCDYYMIYQNPTKELSKDGSGIKEADASKGIYHFEIGKNRGLLKDISFSRLEVPGMQEQLMLNQVGMYDELKMVYNASITMIGNNLFFPGTKIFVDPGTIGMGSPLDRKSAAYRLGLGGYYIVHGVSTEIQNGVATTSLRCTHEAHADERQSYSKLSDPVAKSGILEEERSGSPDPVPSFISNQRITVPDYYGMYYEYLLNLRDDKDMLVLDEEMARILSQDYQLEQSERPKTLKGVNSREIGTRGTVIYHLKNGRSIKMKNTVNTDAVTLIITANTFPS